MSEAIPTKEIIVTGAAGFVGSHLSRELLKDNRVIGVDDLSTGSMENIADLVDNPNFMFIKQDITRPLYMGADQIYNLACPASPIHYQADPIQTTKTNVLGSFQMLDIAKRSGARILQASTSEVYGDPLEHPQKETYWGNVNPNGIRSCYDEGKRCAESLFFDYGRQGTDIRVVRIFNTYGPAMAEDDGRVVSNFIVNALKGRDLEVYGDGTQTRSFMFVSDLVRGMIAVMNGDEQLVNLGNPDEYYVRELAGIVLDMTDSKSEVVYKPLPGDDPKRRKPDITIAKSLGWQPEVSLSDGLQKTIDYFRERV